MKNQLSLSALLISEAIFSGISAKPNVDKTTKLQVRPNILFCIADDASYPHFSANGSHWIKTPSFDRVAREGILFSNCYTPNAKSGPSRSCVLTGLYSWQAREAGNHVTNFPADLKVVTEALAENGYDIAFTGKGWAPGNPGITPDGKPRQLTGKAFMKEKLTPPTMGISPINYASNFSDFLNENNGKKPWFFWFGSHEPHRSYEFGTGEKIGLKTKGMIDDFPLFWPDNDDVRTDMLDYGYEIEYFDKQIQKMMSELEKRGLLENTIIVITSDNGMPFPRSKANDYEYSNHMPLAIMWKNGIIKPGRKIIDFVNFVDFTPTFLDVSKTNPKKFGMQQPSGKSLRNIFFSEKNGLVDSSRNYLLLGRERDDYGRPDNQGYPIRAIIRDNFIYINNMKPNLYPAGDPETGYLDCDGSPTKTVILNMKREGKDTKFWDFSFGFRKSEELYNLANDKFCMNNLAEKPEYAKQKQAMKKQLFEQLKKQKDPRMFGKGDVFDKYPFDENENWNFYEKVIRGEIKEPWKITKWVNPSDYDTYYYQNKK
ncbi:MAG: sulfatase [Paludibacter sp.]|nr:sulfatase [Paludibacter sp.]